MPNNSEVPEPILNSPLGEPAAHWLTVEAEPPRKMTGRRNASYHYRDPRAAVGTNEHAVRGEWRELTLVNLIREWMKAWRAAGSGR